MNDFSLIKKIEILMNLIASSPLFLFCCMLGVAVFIFFIICIKKYKNVNKWIFISIWLFLAGFLMIIYNSVLMNFLDILLDNIFMALYFPNITIYIIILFFSNFSFIYSLISKKSNRNFKILNFINMLVINLLLVLIIDISTSNNINITNQLDVYSNSNLLVLFQLTTAVFTSWLLINLLISAHVKLKKYDTKYQDMPEIIFEEV